MHVVERRQRDPRLEREVGHAVDQHLGLGREVQPVAHERAGLEQDRRVLRRAGVGRRDVVVHRRGRAGPRVDPQDHALLVLVPVAEVRADGPQRALLAADDDTARGRPGRGRWVAAGPERRAWSMVSSITPYCCRRAGSITRKRRARTARTTSGAPGARARRRVDARHRPPGTVGVPAGPPRWGMPDRYLRMRPPASRVNGRGRRGGAAAATRTGSQPSGVPMASPTSRSVPLSAQHRLADARGDELRPDRPRGVAWTVLLLLLLVLQEFLRASGRPVSKPVRPDPQPAHRVMVVAFSVAAVLRLGLLVNPPGARPRGAPRPRPS